MYVTVPVSNISSRFIEFTYDICAQRKRLKWTEEKRGASLVRAYTEIDQSKNP
jgi:hypothetical protein